MSTDDLSIVQLVQLLLRGIQTDTPIDPLEAAKHFDKCLEPMGLMFTHRNAAGYVHDDDAPVMYAAFTADGVTFDDHTEHDDTLRVIHIALHTLTHCEQTYMQLQQTPDDDDSESDEWV